MKKPPVFITDIKSSHNFILFHKDLRSRIASSTARNFSKDNLLYHNLSESKYLWPYFTNSQNSNFFSIPHLSKLDAKQHSFFIFKKKAVVSLSKISRCQIFVKMQKEWVLLIFVMKMVSFFRKIFGKSCLLESRQSEKMKNEKLTYFWARKI